MRKNSCLANYVLQLQKALCDSQISYLDQKVELLSKLIYETHTSGRITAIFGNGGSAADSQHWVGELTCTYGNLNRKPVCALALTCNSSVLTAWANDVSYEDVFARQIRSISSCVGLVIGISTSGKSGNVLAGLREAKELGCTTILICGQSKYDHQYIDHKIEVNSNYTPIIQTITQIIYHSSCQRLDDILMGDHK